MENESPFEEIAKQEQQKKMYETATRTVSRFLNVDDDRQKNRFTRFFSLSDADTPFLRKEFGFKKLENAQKPTAQEAKDAETNLLAFFLEAAIQIGEFRPPNGGALRDDVLSLRDLVGAIGYGNDLLIKMTKERPEDVKEVVKKLLSVSGRSPVPKESISAETVERFQKEALPQANAFLERRLRALEDVTRMR